MEKKNIVLRKVSKEGAKRVKLAKLKKNMFNVAFCLSILTCCLSVGFSTFRSNLVVNASETEESIVLLDITGHTENEIIVEGGVRYFYEDADASFGEEKDNISYQAVIVNGKCTSILTKISMK